jgi:DNA repair photolyase
MIRKGRGAQLNPHSRFESRVYEKLDEYKEFARLEGEEESNKTRYIEVFPKSIVNKVDSPDVPMDWSMNPYQGCEHGCAYCYARPTHEYWGYSSGLEFENTILIKKNAPQLLEEKFNSRSWKAAPIMLSGNTDCYQPIERKEEITRAILKLCLKYKHPVGIITKNALVLRDLDVLTKLAKLNLVKVNLSITTLNEELRRKLEPRTSSGKNRVYAVKRLAETGVPVSVLMAPVIPGLNSNEIHEIFKTVGQAGARVAFHLMVRLNGPLQPIFKKWLELNFPDRAEKVLNLIKESHGGKLNDSRYKTRMRGEGAYARSLSNIANNARLKYFEQVENIKLNCELFEKNPSGQMRLEF